MGDFTEAIRNGWLDDFTSGTLYLALFVGDPAGAGVEVSGSNYARVEVLATAWPAASAGSCANTTAVTFAKATDVWSADDVTYWALYSALTGGTLQASDDLPVAQQQPIVANNTVEFGVGDIVLTASNAA